MYKILQKAVDYAISIPPEYLVAFAALYVALRAIEKK
jgi:hypothetical protein